MFALFFSLYYAMFTGSWQNITLQNIPNTSKSGLDTIGMFITSLFNDVNTPFSSLGSIVEYNQYGYVPLIAITSLMLALITSIGIVVMAVKGIKKAFGIFFGHIR